MAELREDVFSGRRVLIVRERIRRPSDWRPAPAGPAEPRDHECPFCQGNEDRTPPEIWALRESSSGGDGAAAANTPGWRVRVVPNKYPIVEPHELIIETPEHDADLPDLSLDHVERVVEAYRQRMDAMIAHENARYPALFKNHGRAAGASRIHAHAQLVGLPAVPPLLEEELHRAREAHRRREICPYCETIERELQREERVVRATERFVLWVPYAARMPLECWILPRRHEAHFGNLSEAESAGLAGMLRDGLGRIRDILGSRYAYNFYLHTAPPPHGAPGSSEDREVGAFYHWHFEIVPRIGTTAGLEWGTGLYVNPVPPEESARRLRRAEAG